MRIKSTSLPKIGDNFCYELTQIADDTMFYVVHGLYSSTVFVAFVEDNGTMSSTGYFENHVLYLYKTEGRRPY